MRLSYSYATLEEIEIGIKTCKINGKVRGESNETICNLPNYQWRKYLAAYAETKQEAIEKAELLGLRTGNRYTVITAEEADGLTYP